LNDQELALLIEGCRQGDAQCQKRLFLQMYNFGMSVAARYGQHLQETEEIANDGFYKMLENIDRYRPEVPFQLWLRRIIINCGIDHYRKQQTRQRAQISQPTKGNIRNAGADELDREYLLQLVRQLSPQYRMVFVLHVIEGFSHEEIAEQLGISRGTSKSNLAKARKKLQEQVVLHNRQVTEYGK
jgi:RNA polymerase sigma-70 factor (ECF subfamily)